MDLPDEDPRDFLFAMRLAMRHLYKYRAPSVLHPWTQTRILHFPFPCERFGPDEQGCGCPTQYTNEPSTPDQIPPPFRICSNIERLGFHVPTYCLHQERNYSTPAKVLSPIVLEWALSTCLPGGLLEEYTIGVLEDSVRHGYTALDTYEAVLEKYAVVRDKVSSSAFFRTLMRPGLKVEARWSIDSVEGIWKRNHNPEINQQRLASTLAFDVKMTNSTGHRTLEPWEEWGG